MKRFPSAVLAGLIVTSFCVPGLYAQQDVLTMQDISLESLLDVRVSTASKYEQTAREAPAAVTVITAEDIKRYGYQSLGDVLASVRGFYTSYDRNYAYLGTRGFGRPTDDNNRILVLINGLSTNDGIFGSSSIGTALVMDLSFVEKIEVIRGPGSALYGTSAMFAVINIVTRGAETLGTVQASAKVGSYGQKGGSVLLSNSFDNGLDVVLSGLWEDTDGQNLYFEEFDDPGTNQGVSEQLDWERRHGFRGTAAFKGFTMQAKYSNRQKGIPTAPGESAFNASNTLTTDSEAFVELKYEQALSTDKNVSIRGFAHHYGFKGVYPYDWGDEIVDYFEQTSEYWGVVEGQFRWDTSPNNRLIVGSEYRRYFNSHYKAWDEYEVYNEFNAPFSVFSVFAQNDYQVTPGLAVVVGLRHDQYSTVGGATTPRLGLIFNPFSSSTLKLLYGEAFRAPGAFEMRYEGDYFKPNPDLQPESIETLEALWEQRLTSNLSATVSVFDYTLHNLIEESYDPDDELSMYQNTGEVEAQGIEAEINARFEGGLSGYASYTYQNARETQTQAHLTNSPEHMVKAGITIPFLKQFFVAAQMRYETERLTVYETRTDAYTRADINLSTRRLFGHLSPSLLIRNVFDARYALPGGYEHVQPTLVQDGRNVVFKVEIAF